MKKISILSLHLGYGGIEKSIVALANLLCDKYQVEIACSYKLYDKEAFTLDERVKVKYLIKNKTPNRKQIQEAIENKEIINIFKEGLKGMKTLHLRKSTMINYIKSTNSDIIISTRDIFDEWLGEYGKDCLKIGWEHNHYHNDLKYAEKVTRSSSKLDYLVLVSKDLQKFYSKTLRKTPCKCVYIPNVLDSIPSRVSKLDQKRLVSVGRLSPEKGYIDLLKMFNIITYKHPDWVLDIVGDGVEKEKLEKYIKEKNLTSKVTLHGYRGKDYIDKVLDKSSIYVMTSLTESFGIVLIEAMSHGLPCIAFSSAEGARELIDSGKTGYLIKNRSYRAYLKKLNDLINDKETRKIIGRASRKNVKQYSGDVVIKDWIKLIESK